MDESNNRKILEALRRGISVGKITGNVDNINYDKINDDLLNDSIVMATKIGCKAGTTIELLEMCELLRDVRRLLKSKKFDNLLRLDETKTVQVSDEGVKFEIVLAVKESNNQRLLKLLKISLVEGHLPGQLGDEENFNFIKTKKLEDAVQEASKFNFASDNLVKRYRSGDSFEIEKGARIRIGKMCALLRV